MFIIVAEKPSVAMTIAKVLGNYTTRKGYLEGEEYICSWCLGHLADFAPPEEYDPEYQDWKFEDLPIIPEKWKLVIGQDKEKQFDVLDGLLKRQFEYVVNACDAGREGELIFQRVYELSKCILPVRRLWISSMEDEAIRHGFEQMRMGEEYRDLQNAALCRARADWLVGMNATRAFTTTYYKKLIVGRVQTPTLAMLVQRQEEIDSFRSEPYYKVFAEAEGIRAVSENIREKERAEDMVGSCNGSDLIAEKIDRSIKKSSPPRLYDLTALQKDANRIYGYTAKDTLSYAQKLYEAKYITYPRTDSRYITADMEDSVRQLAEGIPDLFAGYAGISLGNGFSRIINDKKVSDHHAILPTMSIYDEEVFDIPEEPSNILFMICLQLLKAISDPCEYEEIKVRFQCGGYRFTAGGKQILKKGYRAFENGGTGSDGSDPEEDTGTLPVTDIQEGMIFHKVKARYEQRSTRAPRPYTEDILLAAMESAGRGEFDDDTERKGLGTPATRAAVIERLISCGYARREGRIIRATEDGKILVGLMPEILTSAKLTADWENALLQMEKGKADPASFMDGIREMIMKILEECRKVPAEERSRFQAVETAGNCPVCGSPVCIGKKNYYCSNRDCGFVIWRDLAFIRSMKKMVDDKMAEELLAKGKTYIRDLYSSKTKKTFPATLVMKVADGKAQFSLEFPHKDKEPDEKTGKDGKKRNFKW